MAGRRHVKCEIHITQIWQNDAIGDDILKMWNSHYVIMKEWQNEWWYTKTCEIHIMQILQIFQNMAEWRKKWKYTR